jgi:hypothetical protein
LGPYRHTNSSENSLLGICARLALEQKSHWKVGKRLGLLFQNRRPKMTIGNR